MTVSKDSVAFFGIEGDRYSNAADAHLRERFSSVRVFWGTNEVPNPAPSPGVLDVDWLFSFKTKTIFREETLNSVSKGALNFHTASPKYPGSGGVNWVLFNGDSESAITVHRITNEVDAGEILKVDWFDCAEDDEVESLLTRTYENHLCTFKSVTDAISKHGLNWRDKFSEKVAGIDWAERTYRIADLEALKRIDLAMSKAEVERIVRATRYRQFGPYVELHGYKFLLAD